MKILTKLIGDTAIVVIGEDVLTREVSPTEWIELTALQEEQDIRDFMNPMEKIRRLQAEAERLLLIEKERELYYKNIVRTRKAKRIVDISKLFSYDEEGLCYLDGTSIPMPELLCEALLDAKYNPKSKYTVNSLVNFWKWTLLNPNPEARQDLFKWFQTGEFTITEEGNVVAYRCVDLKTDHSSEDLEYHKFITSSWAKIKTQKKSPKNFYITKDNTITKEVTPINLDEEYRKLTADEIDAAPVYTDRHTRTMEIVIGKPVTLPRDQCDSNRNAACSSGLHFMSLAYNLRYGQHPLIVLVNPRNIVAFPAYDNSKGRCCEYFPVATAQTDDNGNIIPVDNATLDIEYSNYSKEILTDLFDKYTIEELQCAGELPTESSEEEIQEVKASITDIVKQRVVKLNV